MDKSLINIYIDMMSKLKATMNFDQCCSALGLENVWGQTEFTPVLAIELFITYANLVVNGKATYVFQKGSIPLTVLDVKKSPLKAMLKRSIKRKERKCRKKSLKRNH